MEHVHRKKMAAGSVIFNWIGQWEVIIYTKGMGA